MPLPCRSLLVPALIITSLAAGPLAAQSGKQSGKTDTPAATAVSDLGQIGEWSLHRTGPEAQPLSCTAYRFSGSEEGLRFEARHDQTAIGFIGYATAASDAPLSVTIWFDDNRAEARSFVLPLESDESGLGWRNYRTPNDLPDPMLDLFANASSVHFAYEVDGPQVASHTLRGSSRAMQATLACAMPGSVENPVTPDASPDAPSVIRGSCRLVVDGRTYIDRRGDCPIWMQNDGSGTFWINTDRESPLPDYFATLEPQGNGIGWAYWNAEPGATHAQAPLGEDFRMGAGGCWSNARATICAAR